jgi:tetratricopeptide (TPR) repeat protein
MQHRRDEVLAPALAREVCERNNDQAMIRGTISKMGSKYLVILGADSCVSGQQLAGYQSQIRHKEEVLSALDKGVEQVRKQLGESNGSRERFQTPMDQATTPSLEALRAFSESAESFRRGDMNSAQTLLTRATTLDPQFATAYRMLASTYYNNGDYAQASAFYKKAFDLRERTTERERLGIEIMYYGYGLNDYEESIRRTKQFLQIYPNVANSWVSLCNMYSRLGEYSLAVDAAEHAVRIDPHHGVANVELARAYMKANRFPEAKAIALRATAEGRDHWDMHSFLFEMAFIEHDTATMKAEGEWGLTHQHVNLSLSDLALAATAGGRLRAAMDYFARSRTEALRAGETDFADGVLLHEAQVFADIDDPRQSVAALNQMKGDQGEPGDQGKIALLRAMADDLAPARLLVATAGSADERNTVKIYIYVPLLRALLAMKAGRPAEAVQMLEPARPYQLNDFQVPYLRAEAETEAGMLDAAAEDYRLILNNPGADPTSPLYPLSHLHLARVLVLQKKTDEAREQYRRFLDAWKNADPDLPVLLAAKQEIAQAEMSSR